MKIGILTQPLKSNYGGIIQNWALQQVLIKMGHEPITIDYLPSTTWNLWIKINISRLFLWIKDGKNSFKYYPKTSARHKLFDNFVKDYILTTNTVHEYSRELIKKYKLDVLLVGSDQVWRPKFNENTLYDMYLKFAKGQNVKRISYAASFGTDIWEYSTSEQNACSMLVKSFSGVSVREESGVGLCKNNLGVDAVQVLDPTLLLDRKDYELLIQSVPPINTTPFLAAYILDLTDDKKRYIQNRADELNLKPMIYHAAKNAELTPKQWISIFRDASYVITDSFHGSVFSIIFSKQFDPMGNSKRGNSRFEIIERLRNNSDIEQLRKDGLKWLENHLQQ